MFSYGSNARITSFDITEDDISLIIKNLDPAKARGCDNISIYLFNHFQSNKLFTSSQSGFLPGDSCIAQLLSVKHEIQAPFDNNPTVDVRDIFLDISKAFDKV